MHDPSRVRVLGPLEVFASGFAAELARLGYWTSPVSPDTGGLSGSSYLIS